MSKQTEADRIIASQLRETYREMYFKVTEAFRSAPIVGAFLSNASIADDYTLCELESTYHASRAIEPTHSWFAQ